MASGSDTAMLHHDRARAESFGANAEQYDRSRPSYPAALVGDLLAGGARRVLDVGCGTGIVSRLFLARGCTVLGVETDPRMAAVARRHGLAVETGKFEDWDPAGRQFDLVVSGQAWHWVDPVAGARQAGRVLPPGGALAVFWSNPAHEPDLLAAMTAVYARLAPELGRSLVLGLPEDPEPGPDDPALAGAVRSGLFGQPQTRTYEWVRVCTAAEWLDGLPSYSDHHLLAPDRLAALISALRPVLEPRSPLRVPMRTGVLIARRSGAPGGRRAAR